MYLHLLPPALFIPLISATSGILDITTLLQPSLSSTVQPPWSHPPHCPPSAHPYCIYTSNTTGPHGLSLILPPSAARKASESINTLPISSFLTQHQAEQLYLRPSPWEIVEVPGKDKGVIATRKIRKYETVMIDQAAVVVDSKAEKVLRGDVRDGLLEEAVDRLGRMGRETVRGMYAAEEEEEGDESLEHRIFKANAFGSMVGGVAARALYPVISRINHACSPNAYVMFSQAGISMAIKAYRDIEPGEEITISYILLGHPSQTRHSLLHRWGFTCTCPLCSLPAPERQASDIRRTLIARLEPKIIELAGTGQISAAIDLAMESVEMILDEGDLESLLTDEYAMLAMLWLEKGDRGKAEMWGRKAWRLLGDLGYLGNSAEENEGKFSLEVLLEGIGGLGGDGKERGWRRGGS